jgi:hypothetical protein
MVTLLGCSAVLGRLLTAFLVLHRPRPAAGPADRAPAGPPGYSAAMEDGLPSYEDSVVEKDPTTA